MVISCDLRQDKCVCVCVCLCVCVCVCVCFENMTSPAVGVLCHFRLESPPLRVFVLICRYVFLHSPGPKNVKMCVCVCVCVCFEVYFSRWITTLGSRCLQVAFLSSSLSLNLIPVSHRRWP